MKDYRKRPVVIQAVQFLRPDGETASIGTMFHKWQIQYDTASEVYYLEIPTLEGVMRADENDWIIQGIKGEHYPCKPDIFEATYDEDSMPSDDVPQDAKRDLSFSEALNALKMGHSVARAGWNGKNMCIFLIEGRTVEGEMFRSRPNRANAIWSDAPEVTLVPHIDMKAAGGEYVTGWLASQTDMLASDWEVVGEGHQPEDVVERPKCQCGKTKDHDGFCDGSHATNDAPEVPAESVEEPTAEVPAEETTPEPTQEPTAQVEEKTEIEPEVTQPGPAAE